MKNKCVPFLLVPFLLKCVPFLLVLVIMSVLAVNPINAGAVGEPTPAILEQHFRTAELMKKVNPHRPFTATWPNSDGLLLDIQMNTSTRTHAYSIDRVGDGYYRHFRSFITSIVNHLSSTLDGLNIEQKDGAGEPEIKVVFVRKELIASKLDQIAAVPLSLIPEDKLSCRLESPWVKLDIQRSPVLRIHAVFFWNERQFFIDQALLSGALVSDLSSASYDHALYMQYYDFFRQHYSYRPGALEKNRASGVATRIPAELLWLFQRRSYLSRDASKEQKIKSYSALVQSLFDQCYSSGHYVLQHYNTIMDIRNVVSLDQYQMNWPIDKVDWPVIKKPNH